MISISHVVVLGETCPCHSWCGGCTSSCQHCPTNTNAELIVYHTAFLIILLLLPQDKSGWTMLGVLGMQTFWMNAPFVLGGYTTVTTMMMLVLCVCQVCTHFYLQSRPLDRSVLFFICHTAWGVLSFCYQHCILSRGRNSWHIYSDWHYSCMIAFFLCTDDYPSKIENVTVTQVTSSSVTLSWTVSV